MRAFWAGGRRLSGIPREVGAVSRHEKFLVTMKSREIWGFWARSECVNVNVKYLGM